MSVERIYHLSVLWVGARQHYLRRLLEPVGFSLSEARNGQEAIALCEAWQPHLIIMDIMMPVMDGREATRAIKASSGGRNVAIVALSASAFEEDREAVLAAGADDFLRKPVTAEELLAVIGHHLGIAYEDRPEDDASATAPAALATTTRPSAIEDMPADLLAAMRRAVFLSDDQALGPLITRLPPDRADRAAILRRHVARFDWEALDLVLNPGGHQGSMVP